jgi:hypothetical protein
MEETELPAQRSTVSAAPRFFTFYSLYILILDMLLVLRFSLFSLYHFDEIPNNCLAFRCYDAFWMELHPLQKFQTFSIASYKDLTTCKSNRKKVDGPM